MKTRPDTKRAKAYLGMLDKQSKGKLDSKSGIKKVSYEERLRAKIKEKKSG